MSHHCLYLYMRIISSSCSSSYVRRVACFYSLRYYHIKIHRNHVTISKSTTLTKRSKQNQCDCIVYIAVLSMTLPQKTIDSVIFFYCSHVSPRRMCENEELLREKNALQADVLWGKKTKTKFSSSTNNFNLYFPYRAYIIISSIIICACACGLF